MGYALIGTNSAGCNAFYIRREFLGAAVAELSVKDAFVDSQFRESRDAHGNLTFLSGQSRCEILRGMPVFNTLTGQVEAI